VCQHDAVRLISLRSAIMEVIGRLVEFENPGITKAKIGNTELVIVRDGERICGELSA
jgi:hypothetical protein